MQGAATAPSEAESGREVPRAPQVGDRLERGRAAFGTVLSAVTTLPPSTHPTPHPPLPPRGRDLGKHVVLGQSLGE